MMLDKKNSNVAVVPSGTGVAAVHGVHWLDEVSVGDPCNRAKIIVLSYRNFFQDLWIPDVQSVVRAFFPPSLKLWRDLRRENLLSLGMTGVRKKL